MNRELIKSDWYNSLLDECKAIIIETIFNSRWALVEGYWKLGERVREDKIAQEHAKGNKSFVQDLARNLKISDRTLYYSLQAYDKFPALDKIPEGKNISWNKLITLYLPAPKEIKEIVEIPKGKYEVIVIDPPWNYGTEYNNETRRIASPYKEIPTDELLKFKIPSAENCVLWLWTTHQFIWDAKKLIDGWGFEYKLVFVWNKQRMGMGAWLRCQAEFCLLAIKGKPKWNLKNERDVLSIKRKEHSRKPDEFYKMVESLCPAKKKIDIFSREKRKGWGQYGNETDKFGE